MDLQALIAKARESVGANAPTDKVPVELGGEYVEIEVRMVAGSVWADLTAMTPPRPGSKTDQNVGYNTDAVAAGYPVDHITVAGESVDVDTWRAILAVLSSPSLKLIAAALWGLNQLGPSQRIAELGKAQAGALRKKRSSPAS